MSELNQTEMIALYLQGELGGKELEQFNARLATDDTFKREVEVQRAIVKNITHAGRHELKSQLKQYHQQIVNETDASAFEDTAMSKTIKDDPFKNRLRLTKRKRVRLLLAASIVTALTAVGLGYYTYLSPENIFNDQFTPYTMRTMRGSSPSKDIISLYREHDYDNYLAQYQAREIKSLREMFLAGNAYLIKAQPAQAIQCFRQVMTENETLTADDQRYYEDSEYFLALAYLKNNEPDKADAVFKKITTAPQHSYKNEVGQGLLLKMKIVRFKSGVNQ